MRSVRRRLSIPSTTRLMWLGLAVEPRTPLAGLLIDVPAELRCDHDLVAERRHAFAEDALHLVRTVGLGRVEEGDATVEGRPDDVDHLRAGTAPSSGRCGSCSGRQGRRWRLPASRAFADPVWVAWVAELCAERVVNAAVAEAEEPRTDTAARLPAASRNPRRPLRCDYE